jgi:two-component system response regulator FixJ
MNSKSTVYIVEDEAPVRAGLVMILETAGFVCQAFESSESFLEHVDSLKLGCLLLDVNLPGLDGDELQAELIRRNINLPIIFLTAHTDIPTTVRTIKAGAVDFLTKPIPSKQLVERIQAVFNDINKNHFRDSSTTENKFLDRLNTLTSREMEILPFALAGLPNKEIAQKLGISHRTVEIHRIRILKKTCSFNFLELAKLCEEHKVKLLKVS